MRIAQQPYSLSYRRLKESSWLRMSFPMCRQCIAVIEELIECPDAFVEHDIVAGKAVPIVVWIPMISEWQSTPYDRLIHYADMVCHGDETSLSLLGILPAIYQAQEFVETMHFCAVEREEETSAQKADYTNGEG